MLCVLAGEITRDTSPAFTAAVRKALRTGPSRVELDCSAVLWIDDEGMFALLDLDRYPEVGSKTLMLTHVPGHIRELLDQTLLPAVLGIDEPSV